MVISAAIIDREMAVSALRAWMAQMGKHLALRVRTIAKIQTVVQMSALILLIAVSEQSAWMLPLGATLLMLSVGLTLWSMSQYLKVAWPDLTFRA